MDRVTTMIRLLILLLCAVLFLAGAMWNLCVQPDMTAETISAAGIQQEQEDVLLAQRDNEMQDAAIQVQQAMENHIAALRMERDAAWQQLYDAVEALEFAEKQQKLNQYALLQYTEQKLELLLAAKGIEYSLAVLGINQANIIVPENVLQQEYEKLFDIVLRNTDYDETQIILVPLK